ncbi:ABC transporter ATP-binding protein/permease [Microbacterium sp. EYE_5]|uniref:ABC transporter ATP-binding protein n=1 Tax=unclassified Microbacterium TaxID=2609290 RepID=UPI002004ED51|nr:MULTISPECIES: ABC transporter ATP-binding protein [unclassified Microbacterium]MCK6081592.1 ABC transporter ATP-binding protein/permease [Microbacterium sp. EYE_382]MCK6086862.1 ABC transporter ATP-binding protein/permease [Microbacterium sp. EYE_384]MCK6123640.1 ABC transporter ATP-binding protein/permease [Microbacterium sp. EYE_80]MCK6126549.1 ABC transporter ATP-binding protein/permease [Microbacterium sp. EYE_79]MCK6142546.1 ABC transporter ATP-binding protein/permease [Microbacterium 
MSTPRRGLRRPSKNDGPRASLRQLLPFLLEHKRILVVVAVLSVLEAVATLVQPLLVGDVIGRVQAGDALGILVWILVGLVVVSSLIGGFQHYLLQRTGTAVVYSSRRRLIAKLLHLPVAEYDARRTGDLVSRVGTDTTLLYAVLTQGFADSLGNALIFVGAIIAMLVIDPVLLLLIVVVIGASAAVVGVLSGRIRRATTEQQEKVGALASGVERAIGSIRTIRASGAEARERDAISATAGEAYEAGVKVAKASAVVVPVAGIALQVSLLVVLGVGGFRVASGAIDVAQLVVFVMFLFFLIQPLASFFGAITSVNQALGALGRIQEVLDLEDETARDGAIAASVPSETAPDAAAIEFRDVHFSYPAAVIAARRTAQDEALKTLADAHAPMPADAEDGLEPAPVADGAVLRGVSFRVPRGARVALVGPSGAGKSTTLALIERFYDPTSGSVAIDGVDARALDRLSLRARLGYVEQDAPTLAGTIGDNLRLASPGATDAECERVLDAVDLTEVLERSPLRLDAPVGEAGVMLSGGERQRLAIARALLAAPPILLLDESTSSLDGLNEQRMREAIDAVASGRTLIVIAHRLSTVVDSDLIVVLDHGRVVGQGTHDDLVRDVPLYRDLAARQLLV